MSQNSLISIIIPIFNVEKYLEKCLNSVIKQTYKNIEIILVNDGSQDRCPIICDEYAKMDKRIKVIHQKNAGLSSARNSGIDIAKGDYISFIDSDDYIHPEMYEILLDNLEKEDADMCICNFKRVYDNDKDYNLKNSFIPIDRQSVKVCNKEETFMHLYDELSIVTVVAWNKLYKREIFKSIRYPKGKIHEDEFIIHYIIQNIQKVVYINKPLYFYLQRDTSIIGERYSINRIDAVEAYRDRVIFFEKNNKLDILPKAYNRYLRMIAMHYNLVKKNLPREKDICKKLKCEFLENYNISKKIIEKKDLSDLRLFKFNPLIYRVKMKLRSIIVNINK